MPLLLLSTVTPPDTTISGTSIALRLGLVLFLVLLNAFFVAAEFALVSVRRSRIDQLAAEGDRGAVIVQRALGDLERYISGTQLGITLASLALGWIGEPAVAVLVDRLLAVFGIEPPSALVHSGAAIAVAFMIITFLHIVLGELAPKSLALVMPERVSRLVALPLMAFSRIASPFIWVLNGTANRLLRLIGVQPSAEGEGSAVHSPEELRLLVMQARAHGTLDENDSKMLAGVFDFHEKKAYDVMRPRTDVVAIDEEATDAEVRELVQRERYSRYPIYRETLDDIVGIFVAKDLWTHDGREPFTLAAHMREPMYVPATRSAMRVLDDLRKTRQQLAIVLDEFGGTAGIVTMEDLVEEVVGDIADEHDPLSRDAMMLDGVLEVTGSMSLIDARSNHRLTIPDGEWTTVGGYAFSTLGRLPRVGDRVLFPGGELEVVAMDGRRVAALRVHRAADSARPAHPAGTP
jgi:CBS domain containing-hemolysin-like protein